MRYFMSEAERRSSRSTLYFELQKGHYHNKCWLDDSVCIHADIWDSLSLTELFTKALPDFAYYGLTEVNMTEWEKLKELSQASFQWEEVMLELSPWVSGCFENNSVFTVCGI
jgi:hypothetical protein